LSESPAKCGVFSFQETGDVRRDCCGYHLGVPNRARIDVAPERKATAEMVRGGWIAMSRGHRDASRCVAQR